MKTLIAILLSLSSFAFAAEINLNAENVTLGRLTQVLNTPAAHVVDIKRTSETPEEVVLKTQFIQTYAACTRYASRVIHFPRDCYDSICVPNGRGGERCRPVCSPARRERETYCAESKWMNRWVNQEAVLDFEDAHNLAGGEVEVFRLIINQESVTSDDLMLTAQTVKVKGPYRLKAKSNELKFKANN